MFAARTEPSLAPIEPERLGGIGKAGPATSGENVSEFRLFILNPITVDASGLIGPRLLASSHGPIPPRSRAGVPDPGRSARAAAADAGASGDAVARYKAVCDSLREL